MASAVVEMDHDPEEVRPGKAGATNLADQVRDFLLEQITSGGMKPGDRVNEARLARTLGISRNPIREAVAALAGRGYLVPAPNRGHFIRSFSAADVDSLFAFRIALETFAAREAMARMTLAERAALCRIVEHMVEAGRAGDVAEVHRTDVAFHHRLAQSAGNLHLLGALEAIDCEMRMLIAAVPCERETPLESALHHRPIAEAILAGDAAAAIGALNDHIRATWQNVARTLSGAAPDGADA